MITADDLSIFTDDLGVAILRTLYADRRSMTEAKLAHVLIERKPELGENLAMSLARSIVGHVFAIGRENFAALIEAMDR